MMSTMVAFANDRHIGIFHHTQCQMQLSNGWRQTVPWTLCCVILSTA